MRQPPPRDGSARGGGVARRHLYFGLTGMLDRRRSVGDSSLTTGGAEVLIDLSSARHLSVVDPRYVNPAVAVGWRNTLAPAREQAKIAFERAFEGETSLRKPIRHEWVSVDGADIVAALVPRADAAGWIRAILALAAQQEAVNPVAAMVGDESALRWMQSEVQAISFLSPSPVRGFRSFMRRKSSLGRSTITITGEDPVVRRGSAATRLAINLVSNGEDALASTAIARLSSDATVDFERRLYSAVPAISWRLTHDDGGGLLLMRGMLEELAALRLDENDPRLAAARASVAGEVAQLWESPIELARALAKYEVLGWGGELVRSPRTMINQPDARAVEAALGGLLLPIAQVLGQT